MLYPPNFKTWAKRKELKELDTYVLLVRTPPQAGNLNRITQSQGCDDVSVAGLPAGRKQGAIFPRGGLRGRAFYVNACVYDTHVYAIVRCPSCKS